MTDPNPLAALHQALRGVTDPATGKPLADAGLIDGLELRDGGARLVLLVRPGMAAGMERAGVAAEAALLAVPGVDRATIVLTAHRDAPHASSAAPPAGAAHRAAGARPKLLPEVKQIIAVASGKGGVGKSTTAVNLAVALARSGLSVGLLDADIYGPSLPMMLGKSARPEVRGDRIQPIKAWGLTTMSIGYLVDQDTAMIWRGPMVMGALEQLLGQVDWGPLDLMVIDMPPGTGDAQLTLSQRLTLAGAVIVSTPQDVALIDARRGVQMFEKTNVKVLGLVENMSFFCCPECGARSDIFGHGGARAEAARLGVPFLGEVPLLLDVRRAADAGTPIVAAAPASPAAIAYTAIATKLREELTGAREAAPRFVVS
jgi:ATP-binding protein involved in chromosome partitioning